MSLYQVQKFLWLLNRDTAQQERFRSDPAAAIAPFDLTDEERDALLHTDIGLLYHLGVNGQLLMHFAAFEQIDWATYLELMRRGVDQHGPVREGIYALTASIDRPDDDTNTEGPR